MMNNKLGGAKTRLRYRQSLLQQYIETLNNPPKQGTYWKTDQFPEDYKKKIAVLREEITAIEIEIKSLSMGAKKIPIPSVGTWNGTHD